MPRPRFKYDVALSFSGSERDAAEHLADLLRKKKVKVFYDRFLEEDSWGKDLPRYLERVYRHEARFCVVFVTEEYLNRVWTNHELQMAVARAIKQRGEDYILPIQVAEPLSLPGVPELVYVSLRDRSIENIADLIFAKLHKPRVKAVQEDRQPEVTPSEPDTSATLIGTAVHASGPHTWAVVGARFQPRRSAGVWLEPEIRELTKAVLETFQVGSTAPSIGADLVQFEFVRDGSDRRIWFHSRGLIVTMAGWTRDPFPAATIIIGLQRGVELAAHPAVQAIYRPYARMKLTLGVANWPEHGFSVEGLLNVRSPRPIGRWVQLDRTTEKSLRSDPWPFIGEFVRELLAKAGYPLPPRFLPDPPPQGLLEEITRKAGLHLP